MFHLHVFGCTWFSNLLVCVQISNIPVCTQTMLQTGRWHIHVRHKHPKQNYCNTMKTLFPKTSVALPYFQVAFSFCPNSYKRTENILEGLSQPTSNSSTLSLRTGCSHGFPALKKNKCSYVPRIILAGLRWYDSKWVSRIICLNPDRRSAEPDSVRAENAYLVLLFRGCYTTSHSPPQFSQGNAFFAIPLNIMPILPCISYSYSSQYFLCTYAFYRNKACLTVHATWRLQRYMTSAIFHLWCLAAGHPCNPGSLAAQRHRFVLCHGSTHHI